MCCCSFVSRPHRGGGEGVVKGAEGSKGVRE